MAEEIHLQVQAEILAPTEEIQVLVAERVLLAEALPVRAGKVPQVERLQEIVLAQIATVVENALDQNVV